MQVKASRMLETDGTAGDVRLSHPRCPVGNDQWHCLPAWDLPKAQNLGRDMLIHTAKTVSLDLAPCLVLPLRMQYT